MAYATSDDLIARYSLASLLTVAPQADDTTQLDSAAVALALADAEAMVDVNVRRRYSVPLSPVPTEIVAATCAIARYGLYGNSTNIPDQVKAGFDNVMALLRSIRDGDANLDCPLVTDNDPAVAESEPMIESEPPFFTGNSLKGY
jgi:phage gp36-like protein